MKTSLLMACVGGAMLAALPLAMAQESRMSRFHRESGRYGQSRGTYFRQYYFGVPSNPGGNTSPQDGAFTGGTGGVNASRIAFLRGNYSDAARLANTAVVNSPRDAKFRELLSLALFAGGDYRGAANQARFALRFGRAADWPTLYKYYQNLDRYTEQLRALTNYVQENNDAADAVFLLAYHNQMLGHYEAARAGFQRTLALTPDDAVASAQLENLSGMDSAVPPAPRPADFGGTSAPRTDSPR